MGDAAGYPSEGWVVWIFLSNLGENKFFSVLLVASFHPTPIARQGVLDVSDWIATNDPDAADCFRGRTRNGLSCTRSHLNQQLT